MVDLTPLAERLKDRQVLLVYRDINQQLETAPPDGAKNHQRASLRTTFVYGIESYRNKPHLQNETFSELRARDKARYVAAFIDIADAIATFRVRI